MSPLATANSLFTQNELPQWRESVASGDKTSSLDSNILVKNLFNSITSPTLVNDPPALNNDIEAFRKYVELLVKATGDGTLTENEADVMLRLLAGGFVTRRFNQIFKHISNIDEADWFLAASRS